MIAIKSWSMVICFIAVICAIFETFIPHGNLEKLFKLILGVFMLCSIALSLKSTLRNINFKLENDYKNIIKDNDKLKNTVNDQAKESVRKRLCSIVKEELSKKRINPEKINIIMDINKDNCISIKIIEVFLSGSDEERIVEVKQDLEKLLELNVEVSVQIE